MHSCDTDGKIGPLNCDSPLVSSIYCVEDEYEVTKFIDTSCASDEEILSDTPIKQVNSASSLKIITRRSKDSNYRSIPRLVEKPV